MPLLTIVTLVDEDGDEFPVSLHGDWSDDPRAAEAAARHKFDMLTFEEVERGFLGPRGYLSVKDIEFPTSAA